MLSSKIKINKLKTPNYFMLGAGPTNLEENVLKALACQPVHPIDAEIHYVMDDIKVMLQYILHTENRLTLAIQSSGMGGIECALSNLLKPGDKLMVAITGFWGDKVAVVGENLNLEVVKLRKDDGEIFSLEELEEGLQQFRPSLLFVTHGESSNGTLQKIEGLGNICHKYNCLLAVDAIVSLGAEILLQDKWKVDVVISASQKALGAPPGLAVVSFSALAEKMMFQNKVRPPYYFDLKKFGSYWRCFEEPHLGYHYTFSYNLVTAFHQALKNICDEGIEMIWSKHKRATEFFWEKIEEIDGCECAVNNPANRFHGVTVIKIPSDIEIGKLLNILREKYNINTARGLQSPQDTLRVGFLGKNCTKEMVTIFSEGLRNAIEDCRSSALKN